MSQGAPPADTLDLTALREDRLRAARGDGVQTPEGTPPDSDQERADREDALSAKRLLDDPNAAPEEKASAAARLAGRLVRQTATIKRAEVTAQGPEPTAPEEPERSAFRRFQAGVMTTLGETGLALAKAGDLVSNLTGTDTAPALNAAREKMREYYGEPTGAAGKLGSLVGLTGKTIATLPLGPIGMGAEAAAEGIGGTKLDIAQRRAQGEDISPAKEEAAASASGVIQGLGSFIGGKIFQGLGKTLAGMPGLKELVAKEGATGLLNVIKRVAPSMIGEMGNGATTQFAQNLANRLTYVPDQPLTQGVLEAGLTQAVLAPIMGGVEALGHKRAQTERLAQIREEIKRPDLTREEQLGLAKEATEIQRRQAEAQPPPTEPPTTLREPGFQERVLEQPARPEQSPEVAQRPPVQEVNVDELRRQREGAAQERELTATEEQRAGEAEGEAEARTQARTHALAAAYDHALEQVRMMTPEQRAETRRRALDHPAPEARIVADAITQVMGEESGRRGLGAKIGHADILEATGKAHRESAAAMQALLEHESPDFVEAQVPIDRLTMAASPGEAPENIEADKIRRFAELPEEGAPPVVALTGGGKFDNPIVAEGRHRLLSAQLRRRAGGPDTIRAWVPQEWAEKHLSPEAIGRPEARQLEKPEAPQEVRVPAAKPEKEAQPPEPPREPPVAQEQPEAEPARPSAKAKPEKGKPEAEQVEHPGQATTPAPAAMSAEELRSSFERQGPGHKRFADQTAKMVAEGTFRDVDRDILLEAFHGTDDAYLGTLRLQSNARIRRMGNARTGPGMRLATVRRGAAELAEGVREPERAKFYAQPDVRPAVVALHELAHVGFHTLLTQPEKFLIGTIYRSRPARKWADFFGQGLSAEGRNQRYFSKNPDEFFVQSFAEYVLGQKIGDARMRPLLERVADFFRKAVERLRGRERIKDLEPLYEILLAGKRPTPMVEEFSEQMRRARPETEQPKPETKPPAPETKAKPAEPITPKAETPVLPPLTGARGRDAAIVLPDGRELPATYRLAEAQSLIPSHNPLRGFQRNPGGDVNERPYEDPTEGATGRARVYDIAQNPDPRLLLTDTPTATDGPPVVTPAGVVLGGNARTMAMQVAFDRGGEQADRLRNALAEAAPRFGLTANQVRTMKNPVLVREVLQEQVGEPGELSRVLNQPLTGGRSALTDAVSRGRKLGEEGAGRIAEAIGDRSIREALADPRVSGKVLAAFRESGAFSDAEITNLTKNGELTDQGKSAVEQALLGAAVGDVRSLAEAPPTVERTLVRALPAIVRLNRTAERGGDPSFRPTLGLAMEGMGEMRRAGLTLGQLLQEYTLTPQKWRDDDRAISLMRAFESSTPTAIAGRLREYAAALDDVAGGQARLDGTTPTRQDAWDETMGRGFTAGKLTDPEPERLFAPGPEPDADDHDPAAGRALEPEEGRQYNVDQLGFYRRSERILAEKIQGNKLQPARLAKDFTRYGLTKEELKWSGLEELLTRAAGEGRLVRRKEVQRTIEENTPQVSEVVKGGAGESRMAAAVLARDRADTALFAMAQGVARTGEDGGKLYDMLTSAANASLPLDRAKITPELRTGAEIGRLEKAYEDYRDALRTMAYARGQAGKRAQYASLALPGGENYREFLYTLPSEPLAPRGSGRPGQVVPRNTFESSHWQETNVLAHLRTTDRTDSKGRKQLFLEEVQSDWHQEGRRQGYAAQGEPTGRAPIAAAIQGRENRPPPAPLSENWWQTMLRRAVRMAAEQGYDAIGWTTGRQQAERYDLASHDIQRLEWAPNQDHLTAINSRGHKVFEGNIEPGRLADYVGEGVAARLLSQPVKPGIEFRGDRQVLEGPGLMVQSTDARGLSDFYDRQLPDYAAKYGKRWGAQYKLGSVQTHETGQRADAHTLDITDAMRDSVMTEGQSFFGPDPLAEPTARERIEDFARDAVDMAKGLLEGGKGIGQALYRYGAQAQTRVRGMAKEIETQGKARREQAVSARAQADAEETKAKAAKASGNQQEADQLQKLADRLRISANGAEGTAATKTEAAKRVRAFAGDLLKFSQESQAKANEDLRSAAEILRPLNSRERRQLALLGQGRLLPLEVPAKVRDANEKMLRLMDDGAGGMNKAGALGLRRRLTDGQYIALGGAGEWYPQHLNARGMEVVRDMGLRGITSPKLEALAQRMVDEGQFSDMDQARRALAEYLTSNVNGKNPYFEQVRVKLPAEYIDLDAPTVIDRALRRNAKTVAAGETFGGFTDTNDVAGVESVLGEVAYHLGKPTRAALEEYLKIELGHSPTTRANERRLVGSLMRWQTVAKLGNFITPIRDLGQPWINSADYGLLPRLKAYFGQYPLGVAELTPWGREARREAERAGAVQRQTAIMDGSDLTPRGISQVLTDFLTLPLRQAHTSNQVRAYLIGKNAAMADLARLVDLEGKNGRVRHLLRTVGDPSFGKILPGAEAQAGSKGIVGRRLERLGIDRDQLSDLVASGKPLTPEQLRTAGYLMAHDTQFLMTTASKPLWWDNSPWLRMISQFKRFGIQQSGLMLERGLKEAAMGNPLPLARFGVAALVFGELLAILKDYILGTDKSLKGLADAGQATSAYRLAKRAAQHLANGGFFGVLSDTNMGITDYLLGPTAGTVKDIGEAGLQVAKRPTVGQAGMALKDLLDKNVPLTRQVSGIIDRAGKSQGRAIQYARLRNQLKEFSGQGAGAAEDAIGEIEKRTLGPEGHGAGPSAYSYRYAARAITAGDKPAATEYLYQLLRDGNTPQERKKIIDGIKRTMDLRAPLGGVDQAEARRFLKSLTPEQAKAAAELHRSWLRDYEQALRDAAVRIRGEITTNGRGTAEPVGAR